MSRHWKETLDADKHVVHMTNRCIGGLPAVPACDNIIPCWMYFVEACSFTFQFQSIEELRYCLGYFRIKIHPSDRYARVDREHYWQPWYQRLPQYLFEEPKRKKVVAALERALADFEAERGARS